jgi:cytochrome c oxidase subunit III
MNITMTEQRNSVHPQKLMMWIGMASMFMVFAGFTSAFILQKGSSNWASIELPKAFWISTLIVMASSFTMHKAVACFKTRDMKTYKSFITTTLILGIVFIALQAIGFVNLYQSGVHLDGGPSGAFLYIISGIHGLHMLAAIIALVIIYIIAFRKKVKVYSSVSHEIMATFWHFVDILWVYLFIFFLINFKL